MSISGPTPSPSDRSPSSATTGEGGVRIRPLGGLHVLSQGLLYGSVVLFVAAIAIGLLRGLIQLEVGFHVVFALVLIAFGSLKLSVGLNAWRRLNHGLQPGEVDPALTHGSRRLATTWVMYKVMAASTAYVAAGIVLTFGADRVNQLFGS